LTVLRNNIVLDGQGFTLQGSGAYAGQEAINLTCSNVTVENFYISGWQIGVLGAFDGNVIGSNNFTDNWQDVAVYANNYLVTGNYLCSERIVGDNNVISENVISLGDDESGFWISSSSGTIIESNDVTMTKETTSFISTDNGNFQIFHNNFLNIEVNTGGALVLIIDSSSPSWDNGYPSGGNYWSDYTSRYPDATEIDNSGIWNTSYVSIVSNDVVDRYPLVAPYNISKPTIPLQQNTAATTTSATPTPTTSSSSPPSTTHLSTQKPFPTTNFIGVSGVAAAVVAAVLLVYFKKRKGHDSPRN